MGPGMDGGVPAALQLWGQWEARLLHGCAHTSSLEIVGLQGCLFRAGHFKLTSESHKPPPVR